MRKVTRNIIADSTPETIVREWYHKAYPSDREWKSLDTFTFYDLFELLDNNYAPDFGDSILRERIFQELANVMDVDYNYVYDQWINSPNDINMTIYDLDYISYSDFKNGMIIRESAYDYDRSKRNHNDIVNNLVKTLDDLYLDGEITIRDLKKIKSGKSDKTLNAMLIKISNDFDGSIVSTDFTMSPENEERFNIELKAAARIVLDMNGINENWRSTASEEDIERFRNRYNELKGDTNRKHGWLYFPRSSEDIIADSQDKVADQVYDFIESHKQYFAPDSGIYNRGHFYIEKKFNSGMGRTRLCKIDPKTKTIHLTNVANRFDIKYLEESFPKYKIEKDDKYSPWDRKSW